MRASIRHPPSSILDLPFPFIATSSNQTHSNPSKPHSRIKNALFLRRASNFQKRTHRPADSRKFPRIPDSTQLQSIQPVRTHRQTRAYLWRPFAPFSAFFAEIGGK
jgi:hypothetical protein